jgi:hypothetical protein
MKIKIGGFSGGINLGETPPSVHVYESNYGVNKPQFWLYYAEHEGENYRVLEFDVEQYRQLLINGYFEYRDTSFLGYKRVYPVFAMLTAKLVGYDFFLKKFR